MLRLVADKAQSLKEFTENNYAQGSFFWNYLLKNKEIKINGARIGKDTLLKKGDEVCFFLSPKQEQKPAFYTVYEDGNVIVIDKESGVNSEAVFAALTRSATEKEEECFFIHRLDRNTKGLMIFGKNALAEKALLSAFKGREVEKTYHALCFGKFPKEKDILTAYLKKDPERSTVRVFDKPVSGAEKIVTEYAVLERGEGLTKVEITLHTGKTHQIRAHLAHIGCPVVGDMKYGFTQENKRLNVSRQCLVAKKLRLHLTGGLSYLNEKIFSSDFLAELPLQGDKN